jgi:hypothetical protein
MPLVYLEALVPRRVARHSVDEALNGLREQVIRLL